MTRTNDNEKKRVADDEIDLIEVIKKIWDERRLIYKTVGIFVVLGLVIAFGSTTQYKSEARLLPEIRDQRGGASNLLRQFGGLGGLAGIDIGSMGGADAIRPELYPDVVQSTPFMRQLMNTTVDVPSIGAKVAVYEYMNEYMPWSLTGTLKKYTIGLPGTILGWIRKPGQNAKASMPQDSVHIRMSRTEFETMKRLKERIDARMDQRSGIITITAEFPDPVLAAQIAEHTIQYLTDYITDYRLGKALNDLEFIKERHEEAKGRFISAQRTLANFRDANQNITSARVRSEEERLEAEYNLAFNLYNGLAQQLEQSKIKVQEETPVFKELSPVEVPVERSRPRRIFVLFISTCFGVFLGITVVFIKARFRNS